MPMLQLPSVPAHHAGKMTDYLLHNSEHFFPPLNAVCTLSNLAVTVTAFLYRDSSRVAAEKLPYVATCFGMSIATTAYALLIMVPMNRRMGVMAKNLEVNNSDDKSEKELRQLQKKWTALNYALAADPVALVEALLALLKYELALASAAVNLELNELASALKELASAPEAVLASDERADISEDAMAFALEMREPASRPEVAEAMAAEREESAVMRAEEAAARFEVTWDWIEEARSLGRPEEAAARLEETWDWIEAARSVVVWAEAV
ncbi:hypothetical protein LTS14_005282 [Recurvomyces mirabilis]|uniref:uncharacterized protein n=1 Tax=Recurvomyces mirabilis TaxID=574656 RepID=UPI002DE1AD6C|nr:hypothetical protein LTS14_005282 [Recurvomyces mirabilis]